MQLEKFNAAQFSSDGKYLIIGTADGTVKVVDWKKNVVVSDQAEVHKLPSKAGVSAIDVKPMSLNSYMASSGLDKIVRIWELNDEGKLKLIRSYDAGNEVRGVAFSIDDDRIFVAASDFKVFSLAEEKSEPISLIKGDFISAATSLDGKYIALGSLYLGGVLFTQNSLARVRNLPFPVESERTCSFSYDGSLFFVAGTSCVGQLWYLRSEEIHKRHLLGHATGITSSAFPPIKGNDWDRVLATGDISGVMIMWSTETCLPRCLVRVSDKQPLTDIRFSPDGKNIATMDGAGKYRVWETKEIWDCLLSEVSLLDQGGSSSAWSLENSILVAVAGGGGHQDASLTEDGVDGRDSHGEVILNTGGRDGKGGKGGNGQEGQGGAGYLGPSLDWKGNPLPHGPPALNDPFGDFRGGFRENDWERWGGIGGGGSEWYGTGGGGGYSGGGGSTTYGKSGGGGSFVTKQLLGLDSIQKHLFERIGFNGHIKITTPENEVVHIKSHLRGSQRLTPLIDNGKGTPETSSDEVKVMLNGIQIWEVKTKGIHGIEIVGGSGDPGRPACLQFQIKDLEPGDTLGAIVGQVGGRLNNNRHNGAGGGASILWLCRMGVNLLRSSLHPKSSNLALRLLENPNPYLTPESQKVVIDELLVCGSPENNFKPEPKWGIINFDKSPSCQKLASRILSLFESDRHKLALCTPAIICSALRPHQKLIALELLNLEGIESTVNHPSFVLALVSGSNDGKFLEDLCLALDGVDIVRRLVELNKGLLPHAIFKCSKLVVPGLLRKPLPESVSYELLVDMLLGLNNAQSVCLEEEQIIALEDLVVELLGIRCFDFADKVLTLGSLTLNKRFVLSLVEHREDMGQDGTVWHRCMRLKESKDVVGRLVSLCQKFPTRETISDLPARKSLIDCLDADLRRAYDLTNPEVKESINAAMFLCGRYDFGDEEPIHRSATSAVYKAIDLKTDRTERVVLKFMAKEDQFQREISIRRALGDACQSIIKIKDHSANPTTGELWKEGIAKLVSDGILSPEYQFCIVMPQGDRNLNTIYTHERPSLNDICSSMQHIFVAVQSLHGQGILHGDLKMLNIVRVIDDDGVPKLGLIDLDASVNERDRCNFVGAKFSSGALPPEMFYCIKSRADLDKYKEYFREEIEEAEASEQSQATYDLLWTKICPRRGHRSGEWYIVKTFKPEKLGKGLPFALHEFDAKVDAWALGTILFQMISGEQLFPLTRDDDIASSEKMAEVANWSEITLQQRLKKITDPAARDLLLGLLWPDPDGRLSVQEALEGRPKGRAPYLHTPYSANFFMRGDMMTEDDRKKLENLEKIQEGIDKLFTITQEIKGIAEETKNKLSSMQDVLLRAVFEATEVSVPTSCILLNYRLGEGEESSNQEAALRLFQWVEKAGEKLSSALETKSLDLDSLSLPEELRNTEFYLYLVDELTGEPVVRDPYPIVIKKSTELVRKLVPYMRLGLKCMKFVGGVTSVAQIFLPGVPTVPKDWQEKIEKTVGDMSKESSIEEFDLMNEFVMVDSPEGNTHTQGKQMNEMRGAKLREFSRMLDQYDPDQTFGGLQRLVYPNRGGSNVTCWSTKDQAAVDDIVKAKEELREREFSSSGAHQIKSSNNLIRDATADLKVQEAINEVGNIQRELTARGILLDQQQKLDKMQLILEALQKKDDSHLVEVKQQSQRCTLS